MQAKKGIERLSDINFLPLIDNTVLSGYEGSISKIGDNADWDWFLYLDEHNDWVIFEVDGPGCIYNFVQHRYPSSEEPEFKFYFDNNINPSFTIKHSEFGKKYPFIIPLSDIYTGPEDNGRGPISVVRSFVPMQFRNHCKVTSSVKLTGCEKLKGEGGWGHITYHMYDSPEQIKTFTGREDYTKLFDKLSQIGKSPVDLPGGELSIYKNLTIKPKKKISLLDKKNGGMLYSININIDSFNKKMLSGLIIEMYWDGSHIPDVRAPFGTFFGNEYGKENGEVKTLLTGSSITLNGESRFYNYFPMPFRKSAAVVLLNDSDDDVYFDMISISFVSRFRLLTENIPLGYFTSSEYYPPSENKRGKNSVIAEIKGTGHMVYGTISGYKIEHGGCEGDVRVFIDNKKTPSIESDGSESWACYGWGFVTPPQSNPFSGYHGKYGVNDNWSEIRLTVGDSYTFRTSIRFELEHGDINDGMGKHSGQIFCYTIPNSKTSMKLSDIIDCSDKNNLKSHNYTVRGNYYLKEIESAYENGINEDNSFKGVIHSNFDGEISFNCNIDKNNFGILIRKRSSQEKGRQCARIHVDSIPIKEKNWFYADSNIHYKWLDDEFIVPSMYTTGKSFVKITLIPIESGGGKFWNESFYEIYSILD